MRFYPFFGRTKEKALARLVLDYINKSFLSIDFLFLFMFFHKFFKLFLFLKPKRILHGNAEQLSYTFPEIFRRVPIYNIQIRRNYYQRYLHS